MKSATISDRQMIAVYLWPATKERLAAMAKRKQFKGISPFVCDYLDGLVAQSTDELGEQSPPVGRRYDKRNLVRVTLNLKTTTRSRLEAMSLKTESKYALDPFIEELLETMIKESR